MLSWFSAPRNSGSDSQEPMDNTQIEPPETPAPVFAARAIKHAIWGTPAPPETLKPVRYEAKRDNRSAPRNDDAVDPDFLKRGGGILSTPGTLKGRKSVSFGAQVVDNEGKLSKTGAKSGLPVHYPGKYPSPWTPKVEPLAEQDEERPSSSSKLTQKLYEVRDSSRLGESRQEAPKPKPRAKDDGDITMDVLEPRSESGRYWKEQYMLYSHNSEREVKKVIKKQQIAKEYARKKDAEALELAEKLEVERKRHKQREKELEDKNRDYKERLRQAMAENFKLSTETATLKQRLAVLEGTEVPGSPEDQDLPKTELELEFDQMMLDPQQASHCALDATPVNGRRGLEKAKSEPSPTLESRPKAKDLSLLPPTDSQDRLGASPRRPRRSTTGNRSDKPTASRANAKNASTSAIEDPWVVNGDSMMETRTSKPVSPAKRSATRAAPLVETHSATSSNRPKNARHLQPLANAPGSTTPSTSPENLSPEETRKKLARERILQKKREREMGKENSRANVVSMR